MLNFNPGQRCSNQLSVIWKPPNSYQSILPICNYSHCLEISCHTRKQNCTSVETVHCTYTNDKKNVASFLPFWISWTARLQLIAAKEELVKRNEEQEAEIQSLKRKLQASEASDTPAQGSGREHNQYGRVSKYLSVNVIILSQCVQWSDLLSY